MSVKNRERQIFDPRISRTYIIIYSDVPWVFLDHLEILFLWKRFHGVSKDINSIDIVRSERKHRNRKEIHKVLPLDLYQISST